MKRRTAGDGSEQICNSSRVALLAADSAQQDSQRSMDGQSNLLGREAGCRIIRQQQIGSLLFGDPKRLGFARM